MYLPSLPWRVAALSLLAWSPLALAQAPVARVRREQQLVLSEPPAGTELALRLALGFTTVVRFDAQVERAELKGTGPGREVRLDVAPRFLVLEPLQELPSGEPPKLEVVLTRGPERFLLRFPLLSHPAEVDAQVEVELRPRAARSTPEPEPPAPSRELDPFSRFLLSRDLKRKEAPVVTASSFNGESLGTGVSLRKNWDCYSEGRRHLALLVFNPVGGRPWLASEVVRLAPTGSNPGGGGRWTVAMEGPIAPGSFGQVVVVVPREEAAAPVRVEVREKDGERRLLLEEAR
ncbi:DUF2381 family protein [Archangium sp.]|uniref:DUF2381 family protein n=1 Tax=Archangium sp. TaxID=1872627 RepID=UPI00286CA1C1|nr:DUF2381 family protein [Archangium sp.]